MSRLIPVLAATVVATLLTGCVRQTYVERQPVDQQPMTVDMAMQQRQWEPVTAYYENGDTVSQSTGLRYTTDRSLPPYTYAATEPGIFLLNMVTLPWTYYEEWNGVKSGGVKLPPSYTAVPPLPPSTQPTE